MAKILLVEDDPQVAQSVAAWLKLEKHSVELATTGADAAQLLQHFEYEVLILDWGLPDTTGPEILRKFRETGGQTPAIILTGRTDLHSKTTGLDSGADDYLTKPVALPELSARIRSRLRRPIGFQPDKTVVDNVALDFDTRQITVSGQPVHLTKKEFSVLEFLVKHPDQTFGARALRDKLWPSDSEVSEDTVRVCIQALRRKITIDDICIVKTIPGSGYTVNKDAN